MRKTAARIAVLLGVLGIAAFVVVLVNQTAQLVELAARMSPFFGSAVLWVLVTLYAFCILVPFYLLFSLPKPLRAPDSEADPEFPAHLERLGARLRRNPHLSTRSLSTREEIEAGLVTLDGLANERTQQAAAQVFVTTAISQNGSLDTFLVLAAQSKLILEIAPTYYQRPTLRDLVYLYSNVAATAFVAGELEDIDLTEQIHERRHQRREDRCCHRIAFRRCSASGQARTGCGLRPEIRCVSRPVPRRSSASRRVSS